MKLKFETADGQTVRVTAPIIHLIDKGPEQSSFRYMVAIGERWQVHLVRDKEYERLASEWDSQGENGK